MIGIYKITSPTSRIYIGQSNNIKRRLKEYLDLKNSKKQIRLYRSFKKYGINNHIFEIIEECSFEELNERERYYQDKYNVLGKNGLNCTLTNSSLKPKILSEQTKLKISSSMKGKIKTSETKSKISNAMKGKTHSKETKLKMSKCKNNYKKEKYKTIKDNNNIVYQYDLNDNLIKIWNCFRDILIEYKNNERGIWNCLINKQKTSLNYKWTYDIII